MVKKFFKKKSKRMSCNMKYKIRHKVAEHNKKIKKVENLKQNKQYKKKQQFNIPNSFPFKEELLQQALEIKTQKQLEKKQKALQKREKKFEIKNDDFRMEEDGKILNEQNVIDDETSGTNNNPILGSQFKTFRGMLKQVISESNVLLLVLDARDPLGTCCLNIDKLIPELQNTNKRLVLLLNKIDMVPYENAMAWVKYLKTLAPTLPFKASVQAQQNHLGTSAHSGSSCAFGREHLMKLLGNYCRSNHKTRSSITVGVIGMPNVGKSSVINSLKRKKVCEHGSVPGITRTLKTIKIHKNLSLIDSPGVLTRQDVTSDEDDVTTQDGDRSIVTKNVIRVDQIDDPVEAVGLMLKKCDKKEVILRYKIPSFEGTEDFLVEMARKLGKLKKGGRPDIEETARHVIKDWNQGKIKYFTAVPEASLLPAGENIVGSDGIALSSSEIVTKWSQEFDIDALVAEPVRVPDAEMADGSGAGGDVE